MQKTIIRILIIPVMMLAFSCSPDDLETPGIGLETCIVTEEFSLLDPVSIHDNDSAKLNSIFSQENHCLTWEQDTVLLAINSADDFREIDPCNTVEFIDFSAYTLVAGRITTPSISDKLVSKALWVHTEAKAGVYKVEMQKCTECWTAIGTHYFWALYPKIDTSDGFALCMTNE